jgi:hypothetical protein
MRQTCSREFSKTLFPACSRWDDPSEATDNKTPHLSVSINPRRCEERTTPPGCVALPQRALTTFKPRHGPRGAKSTTSLQTASTRSLGCGHPTITAGEARITRRPHLGVVVQSGRQDLNPATARPPARIQGSPSGRFPYFIGVCRTRRPRLCPVCALFMSSVLKRPFDELASSGPGA